MKRIIIFCALACALLSENSWALSSIPPGDMNVRDGSGNPIDSETVGGKRALEINIVGIPSAATATALATKPSGCSANQFAYDIAANGTLTCELIPDAGLAASYLKSDGTRGLSADWNAGLHNITAAAFVGSLTGNASTATAFDHTPTACSANTFSNSIAASGALGCSTVPDAGLAVSYLKSDGSRGLSSDWNAGVHTITATTFSGALSGNATTASNLSGTPALPNGTTATTQSQADASTKLATTAYVDTGLSGKQATLSDAANIAYKDTTNNFSAANTFSANGALSTPAVKFSGTLITGGSGSTNFPLVLINPNGNAQIAGYATSGGTALAIDAPTMTGGDLVYMAVNGTREFELTASGGGIFTGTVQSGGYTGNALGATANNTTVTIGGSRTFSTSGTTNTNFLTGATFSQSGGTNYGVSITPTLAQTSTAAFTAFMVNIAGTPGSGTQLLADFQNGGTSKASIDTNGGIGATNITTTADVVSQSAVRAGNASSATNALLQVKNGHFKQTQTTSLTGTVNANAGTSGSCTASHAVDMGGSLQVVTGSGSWATGEQCKVTFSFAYNVAPICTITPTDASTASLMATRQVYATSSTSIFSINFGSADTGAHTYNFNYTCMETQ